MQKKRAGYTILILRGSILRICTTMVHGITAGLGVMYFSLRKVFPRFVDIVRYLADKTGDVDGMLKIASATEGAGVNVVKAINEKRGE